MSSEKSVLLASSFIKQTQSNAVAVYCTFLSGKTWIYHASHLTDFSTEIRTSQPFFIQSRV